MKKSEIVVGGIYTAKISGRIVSVRVDAIRGAECCTGWKRGQMETRYDVTNLATKRKTTFRSAAKFRTVVKSDAEIIRINAEGALRNIAELHAQY